MACFFLVLLTSCKGERETRVCEEEGGAGEGVGKAEVLGWGVDGVRGVEGSCELFKLKKKKKKKNYYV